MKVLENIAFLPGENRKRVLPEPGPRQGVHTPGPERFHGITLAWRLHALDKDEWLQDVKVKYISDVVSRRIEDLLRLQCIKPA